MVLITLKVRRKPVFALSELIGKLGAPTVRCNQTVVEVHGMTEHYVLDFKGLIVIDKVLGIYCSSVVFRFP